eukprot:1161445-Pelagomonas_calceolata.AAC.16
MHAHNSQVPRLNLAEGANALPRGPSLQKTGMRIPSDFNTNTAAIKCPDTDKTAKSKTMAQQAHQHHSKAACFITMPTTYTPASCFALQVVMCSFLGGGRCSRKNLM